MTPPTADELQKQYERVLQEYRFQVQLNWDRAKHFLLFNTGALAAAVALYKNAASWPTRAGVASLLALASLNSLLGWNAVGLGHGYYQSIRDLKTRLERDLALGEYAIMSTPGMKREHGAAPAGTPDSAKFRWLKIHFQIRLLLAVIAVLSGVGAIVATYETVDAWGHPPEPEVGAEEPRHVGDGGFELRDRRR